MLRRRTPDGQLTWFGKAVRSLGFGRLYYYGYCRPVAALRRRFLPTTPVEVPLFGLKLALPAPSLNFCFEQIYRDRIWEPEVTAEIRRRIKPGMNVVDVGADVGYYVLLLASLNGGGSILAFEPNPVNYKFLEDTVARNTLNQVTLYPFGLGDRVIPSVTFCAANWQPEGAPATATDTYTTSIQILDEVVAGRATPPPRMDFVLMDVEGAEMNVLLGMQQVIERDRPMILIELHDTLLPIFNFTKAGLIEWLRQKGYESHWVSGESLDGPGNSHGLFIHSQSTAR